ncbi:LAMI_0C01574g1_1 [Lachancea mirantina]|uniref:Iron-sulfur assembly protein 1 n=1 Tax=Lachancea mirantina TaxID=1230905 RepID=A0A1G4J0L9_9SACH|nr:LAMI_0C01574g1_1 [Lachancea mirantina]
MLVLTRHNLVTGKVWFVKQFSVATTLQNYGRGRGRREGIFRGESNRRFLQTNNVSNRLEGNQTTRWGFNFVTPSARDGTTSSKGFFVPRDRKEEPAKEPATTAGKNATDSKWSTYSLPSKETLTKQKNEIEEQKAKTENAAAAASLSKPKPKRRLRPRKALISLSPNAILHLKALLNQPNPKLIRIGVKNRGCSGLTYNLEYITEPGKFDEVVEQDGVKVIIDSKALFSIVGSEMDWIDDTLSSRFVFKNPNSKGTCGCGESFMV